MIALGRRICYNNCYKGVKFRLEGEVDRETAVSAGVDPLLPGGRIILNAGSMAQKRKFLYGEEVRDAVHTFIESLPG